MRRRILTLLLTPLVAVAGTSLVPATATTAPTPYGPAPVPLTSATFEPPQEGGSGSAVLGSRVVFRAESSGRGAELWISDGTPSGTRMVKDIWPGAEDSSPWHFVSFRGLVYFAATDGVRGNEMWVTDGTAGGTRMVKDIYPGANGGGFYEPVVAGGQLFFRAGDADTGTELWVSDGTGRGTRLAVDVVIGMGSSIPRRLTAFGRKVAFWATVNADFDTKPFVSDGTAAGTVRLDSLPLYETLRPLEFVALGDRIVFSVYTEASGVDLWVSRGLEGDARLVEDINPGGDDGVTQLTRLGNVIVFSARTAGQGYEPWVSDGTPGGTVLLRDIAPGATGSTPVGYQVVGGRAWFVADDAAHGQEVWVTDGSTSGTRLVRDVVPGPGGSEADSLWPVAGQPLFSMRTSGHGTELWRVDPTGRLLRATDIRPGPSSSDPVRVGAVANTLLLSAVGPSGPRIFALTLRSSTTVAAPRSSYPRRAARKRQIVVPVRVRATATVPTGTVALVRGGRLVGRATVRDGVARVRITVRLPRGRHAFTARYSGSVRAQSSTSPRFVVRVR